MPPLDLYTVRVMTLITVIMSSGATLFAWRTNKSVEGMRWFSLGLLSMTFGAMLGMGAAVNDSYPLMVSGWAFRFGGLMMVGQSIRLFRGFGIWPAKLIAAFAATVAILFAHWLYPEDNMVIRIGVVSSAMSILAGDAAVSMFRRVSPRDRLTYWSTGLVFSFVAIYLGVRGAAHLLGAGGAGESAPARVETIATICGNIAFVGCAFGMLLASNARLRQAAERSALFDTLTGLPNRRFFEDRLLQAEQRAIGAGGQMGVIYIDLDEFKLINDTEGHQAGDDLLKKVGSAMTRVLRPDDCLARVGGDEFVVLVEDVVHRSQLERLADRLSTAIESTRSAAKIATRASYGIAVFPEDGASSRDVVREADTEMYLSKREHRRQARMAG